jgi:two-component system, NarL family, response regulator DevR
MNLPVRIFIVDDHVLVRRGIRSILEQDPHFQILGEAATGSEALNRIRNLKPDLVLLDLQLPDMNGLEVCGQISKAYPHIIILILSAFIDHERVEAGLRAGARGYLLKDAENLNLPEQLMTACSGHHVFDPRAADVLSDYVTNLAPEVQLLTTREISILKLTSEGFTNKEIGDQLHLSENTIKGHVKEILAKTGTKNRIQAVLICKERNLL